MKEPKRIIDFSNEIEATLFCRILDENNIPYHLHSLNDTAYDGIYQFSHGWGFLESLTEHEERIRVLFEDFKNSRIIEQENEQFDDPIENEDNKKKIDKFDIISICIIAVLLIFLIFFILENSNLKREIAYYRNRPLLKNTHDKQIKGIESRWKDSNILNTQYYDENSNLIYEKSISYDTRGNHLATYYDENENGISEKCILYSTSGVMSVEMSDRDEDKRTDKWISYLSDTAYLIWYDQDKDGIAERGEIYKGGRKYKEVDIFNDFLN
ncbi:MAG: hypothetical protein JW881_14775 [Spirochaetales bacterium]|nr:hypothetical protein [Spirochaetales bacterium]